MPVSNTNIQGKFIRYKNVCVLVFFHGLKKTVQYSYFIGIEIVLFVVFTICSNFDGKAYQFVSSIP